MLVSSKRMVTVDLPRRAVAPEKAIGSLASIKGGLDVYTWYEGPELITQLGAQFLRDNLFEPLFNCKKDVKLWTYSLEAWNFQKNVDAMNESTPKGVRINAINKLFVECIYSSSFFKFCTQFDQTNPLYRLINEELPIKQWLVNLSAKKDPKEISVEALLGFQPTLVDSIKTWDVAQAYSMLQYLEGYYLIREAVARGLDQGKQKIQVAFLLPNDESKYYRDLPGDLENMLRAEFGESLRDIELKVFFRFYLYGSKNSRPYLKDDEEDVVVSDSEIENYFNYLPANQGV